MNIKEFKQTYITQIVDSESGAVIDQNVNLKIHRTLAASRESFAQMFFSIVGVLNNLTGAEIKILVYCITHAPYNKNFVTINAPFRKLITKECNIADGTIKNSVKTLVKKGMLIRQGSGSYLINPEYFWKGDSEKRVESLRFVLDIQYNQLQQLDLNCP